jgi:hypothetical protein
MIRQNQLLLRGKKQGKIVGLLQNIATLMVLIMTQKKILDVVEETNQMLEGMVDVAVLEILKEVVVWILETWNKEAVKVHLS